MQNQNLHLRLFVNGGVLQVAEASTLGITPTGWSSPQKTGQMVGLSSPSKSLPKIEELLKDDIFFSVEKS
jgi:hypothetical protein